MAHGYNESYKVNHQGVDYWGRLKGYKKCQKSKDGKCKKIGRRIQRSIEKRDLLVQINNSEDI